MEGENSDALGRGQHSLETSPLRKFRKSVSIMPRFLHRGIAGNMQPLQEVKFAWHAGLSLVLGGHLKTFFKKASVGVSKIDDFCHLGVEGETEGMFVLLWLRPYNDVAHAGNQPIKKFSESVSTLPRFLHRGAAGNMGPLTGGDTDVIRWGDRWLLILVRSNLKKFFERGFQKARFWTLNSEGRKRRWWSACWKIFSGGGAVLPGFLHRRLGGIINTLERRKSHGGPKQKDFKLPVSLCPIIYIDRWRD